MKKILLCSYRNWSNNICTYLETDFADEDLIIIRCNTQKKFLKLIKTNFFDYIFFLGWSDIIQQPFYVEDADNLRDIYHNITQIGYDGVRWIVDCMLKDIKIDLKLQDDDSSTYFKRRTPEMSEIKQKDFGNLTAKDIHNKVRCLQDPYPNAYILCKDNTKLYITNTKI
mgnify:CR=1 FL=1